MQLSEIITQVRRLTKTNATNYTDTDIKSDINIANGEIHLMIMEAEGYKNTGGGFETTDLVSVTGLVEGDNGYNGEFSIPDNSVKLDEIYLNYGNGYVKASVVEKSEIDEAMFEESDDYTELNPVVFVYRDSMFVRPLNSGTTVTDGIKILTQVRQDQLVNSDDEPIFEKNFHQLIPLKVAQDYFMLYPEKYNPRIDKKVEELETQLISLYQEKTPIDMRFREQEDDRGLKNW